MGNAMRILLVDDDEETRGLYSEIFANSGFEVSEAKDGLEGLEMAMSVRPDVIFSGIIMPRMDGFALVEALRANVTTASIPIAFCSHLGRQVDQQRAKELGVNDFIVRDTMTPNEVVLRIQVLVAHHEYLISINVQELDAQKFASDFRIDSNFLCSENGGQKFALRLKLRDVDTRSFDAELVCLP